MSKVYNSFAALGEAMGIKVPTPVEEEPRKCKNCGNPLRHISGTNVYVCDYASMEDVELAKGTNVQVFTRCGAQVIEPVA